MDKIDVAIVTLLRKELAAITQHLAAEVACARIRAGRARQYRRRVCQDYEELVSHVRRRLHHTESEVRRNSHASLEQRSESQP